ncbi:hypothetical protein LCL85_01625 [Vibrio alginolyticus]|nr:hypothetical protein [Vibrio alginolyticus]
MLESWLEALALTPVAQWVRFSRWSYAVINTLHVFGIALLVGAIIPLDLKRIGLWQRITLEQLAHVLVPVAVSGFVIAVISGVLLFMAGPSDYFALSIFLFKLLCIALAVANAVNFHWRMGYTVPFNQQRLVGFVSLILWLCALVAGRFIAYV